MNDEEIEKNLCDIVEKSLADRNYKSNFTFKIDDKIIFLAWKKYFIDLRGYSFYIHSDDIRHIKNEHQDDVYHICKIHYYLHKFKNIQRTKTRDFQTGKDIPCLTFTKQLQDKQIKIIKVYLSRKKILKLKTLYEVL